MTHAELVARLHAVAWTHGENGLPGTAYLTIEQVARMLETAIQEAAGRCSCDACRSSMLDAALAAVRDD